MPEAKLPIVGCAELCPLAPDVSIALQRELDRESTEYREAEQQEQQNRQAAHERGERYDDMGQLAIAKFMFDFEQRRIYKQAQEYREETKDCDGLYCKLATFLIEQRRRELNPYM